jgi:hypothetical protein
MFENQDESRRRLNELQSRYSPHRREVKGEARERTGGKGRRSALIWNTEQKVTSMKNLPSLASSFSAMLIVKMSS